MVNKKIMLGLILICFALFIIADTEPPTWSNESVNNTFPKLNDSVKFGIGLEDNLSIDGYIFSWNLSGNWINDSFATDTNVLTSEYCYQEDPKSNVNGCGLTTGNSNSSGLSPGSVDFWNDNNSASGSFPLNDGDTANMYVNYTLPPDKTYGIWTAFIFDDWINFTLPLSCHFDPVKIWIIYGREPAEYNYTIHCGNTTSIDGDISTWNLLYTNDATGFFYEEGIYWRINNNVSVNVTKSINTTKNISSFAWQIHFNDSSNNWNETDIFEIQIQKQLPTATPSIENKPLVSIDDINCTITYSDIEGDTQTGTQIIWYNDSIEQADFENETSIGSANTTDAQTWICSARVINLFNESVYTNDSVTIADSTPPDINNLTVSTTTPTTSDSVTFTANVTDLLSTISTTACKFQLRKSDFDGGKGVGNSYNQTTTSKTNDLLSFPLSMASFGTGTLEWQKSFCDDDSGNRAENSTQINITISSPPVTPPTSGSGSSTTIIIDTEKTDCGIVIQPEKAIFNRAEIRKISIFNSGTISYTPTFSITGNLSSDLSITNEISILPGGIGEFGIKYDPDIFIEQTSEIILIDAQCNDITIKIITTETPETLTIIDELFSTATGFLDFLSEPVFSEQQARLRSKTQYFNMAVVLLISLMLISLALFSSIKKATQKKKYGKTIILIIFAIVLASILSLFIITGVRLI